MEELICKSSIEPRKIFKANSAELDKLEMPTVSHATNVDKRLKLIRDGKELLALGQQSTEIDAETIKKVRRMLNSVVSDCDKLDESKGVYDSEMERKVALFQERHLAQDKRFRGSVEVDGVVGKRTLTQLEAMSKNPSPSGEPSNSNIAPVSDSQWEASNAKAAASADRRKRIESTRQ